MCGEETPLKKFTVKTLGCKANYSDGQSIESGLIRLGMNPAVSDSEADVIVVNSCTVTDEADRQSRKMVRDLAARNPQAKLIYTGCGAEVNPEEALSIPGVSAVVGNQNKAEAAELIATHLEQSLETPVILGSVSNYVELSSRHPMDREWPLAEEGAIDLPWLPKESSSFRTRAFLKIQEGCDSFCTYCIIPYGRGPARSLSIDSVLDRIRQLIDQGVKEVVLTGTNIGEYGVDQGGNPLIDDLLESILTQTALSRLRVGSLDPTEISDCMIDLMERYPSFCPHFHVSLQHTESRILRLMKRKYSRDGVVAFFERVKRLSRAPFIGMDLITGFPGETDEEFNSMVDFLSGAEWSRIHVFPYSERKGTPATRLPGSIPQNVRKERARRLQAMSLERMTRNHAGMRAQNLTGVLLEGAVRGPDGSRDWVSGYSANYQRVLVPLAAHDHENFRNQLVNVNLNRWVVDRASGEVSWLAELNRE
jgi:threonylcarbamoyladenosine tRNA methylthiotransferase MtaB